MESTHQGSVQRVPWTLKQGQTGWPESTPQVARDLGYPDTTPARRAHT